MRRLAEAFCAFALLCATAPSFGQGAPGVLDATRFPGSDIGAQINSAYASVGGTASAFKPSALVMLPPGQRYSFRTTIQIPSNTVAPFIEAPVLDCQGSTLTFAGVGDAVLVHGSPGGQTGEIRNCKIIGPQRHSRTVTSIIHIRSRIGFHLSRLELSNAQRCIDWENTKADGGPGYNEQDIFDDIDTQGCAEHIALRQTAGGTGSFEYNTIRDVHFQLGNSDGEEHGLSLDAGTGSFDMQGAVLDLKGNAGYGSKSANSPLVAWVFIDGRNSIFRSVVDLRGENTVSLPHAYSVYVKSGSFYNTGNNIVAGTQIYVAGQYDQYALHPALGFETTDLATGSSVHMESENYNPLQTRCKSDIFDTSFIYWMPNYGGKDYCAFELVTRATDNTNADVYRQGSSGNAVDTVLFADSRGLGIGPGFRQALAGKPGTLPAHTLDVHGDLLWTRGTSLAPATDLDTISACGVYDVDNATHAPAGGALRLTVACGRQAGFATQIAYADGPSAQSWIRSSTGGIWSSWTRNGGGFSGTRQTGRCTLQIENGLIVAVTGC
jgi:hypothetical protein